MTSSQLCKKNEKIIAVMIYTFFMGTKI